ncbi:hypothetical protein SAY86_017087 [Trapa natans]|uniref:RING-type domain-containing protein n=1 Tax=Trapa natans TaxID=22666 RepID=A0AAN7R8H1_TRANT|nr:hypothetical protein SAY86_017087 [Trapa natans]
MLKQVEHLTKGIKEMQERHLVSLLSAMERGVIKKLLEKDMEIENINRRNCELGERIKQATIEVQSWQYRAKYNESVANVLKTKLQQVISVGAGEGKEGFGDSELDDAASYIDLKNRHERPRGLVCKACNLGEARVLLIPCRHLCICKACSGLVTVCPVCRLTVTDRLDVYMS